MHILLFGSSGMVGSGILLECLDHDSINKITVVNRRSIHKKHSKLVEIIHQDMYDITSLENQLTNIDAMIFCIGISSVGIKEDAYYRFTYEMTMHVATMCLKWNPRLKMVYCSGAGADSSELGKVMWARVRGKLENDLIRMSFQSIHCIRPAFIIPNRGVRSKTKLYQFFIVLLKPLLILFRMFPSICTTTSTIGQCVIRLFQTDYTKPILESKDINRVGKLINHS